MPRLLLRSCALAWLLSTALAAVNNTTGDPEPEEDSIANEGAGMVLLIGGSVALVVLLVGTLAVVLSMRAADGVAAEPAPPYPPPHQRKHFATSMPSLATMDTPIQVRAPAFDVGMTPPAGPHARYGVPSVASLMHHAHSMHRSHGHLLPLGATEGYITGDSFILPPSSDPVSRNLSTSLQSVDVPGLGLGLNISDTQYLSPLDVNLPPPVDLTAPASLHSISVPKIQIPAVRQQDVESGPSDEELGPGNRTTAEDTAEALGFTIITDPVPALPPPSPIASQDPQAVSCFV